MAVDVTRLVIATADQRLCHRARQRAGCLRHWTRPPSVTDDAYFPGGFTGVIYDRLAKFHIDESETLDSQLNTLGYSAADVDTAILSHLHQDHIGGIQQLNGAELVVSATEWQELSRLAPEPRGFLRGHIMIPGLTWRQISFEPTNDATLTPFSESLAVMGDGSLVLLPTPGHTAGSISLLIRRRGRSPLLLVGDLTYGSELLDQRRLPGVGDRSQLAKTTDTVLELKQRMPGLVVLPAHDPTAAATQRPVKRLTEMKFTNTVCRTLQPSPGAAPG